MSEKVPAALRAEAEDIKQMHICGHADADSTLSWYQLWCVLTSIASNIDGEEKSPDNTWSFRKFKPK